jgi:hypothetical protein
MLDAEMQSVGGPVVWQVDVGDRELAAVDVAAGPVPSFLFDVDQAGA